uniref:Lactamase_B domain-containing protein n=1 Tax=Globodera pallida TaxID=36090 RepID=A0A183C377_GLOPA
MFDRNKTLWCGWIIKGPRHKFFYTGDTGFCADEFRKLGDIHGPIDLSAIPIGAYEPRWFMSPQHIETGMPDQGNTTFCQLYILPTQQKWYVLPTQQKYYVLPMTLWCGWIIKGPRHKFFYTGDTGFCADEFRKLGDIHGPIDLSAIPIGAYEPRWFMSPQHIDPGEAVQIHQLAKSKKSLGVHWGTYEMGSSEGYLEPREKLAEAVAAAGLGPDEFVTLAHGQSWRVEG